MGGETCDAIVQNPPDEWVHCVTSHYLQGIPHERRTFRQPLYFQDIHVKEAVTVRLHIHMYRTIIANVDLRDKRYITCALGKARAYGKNPPLPNFTKRMEYCVLCSSGRTENNLVTHQSRYRCTKCTVYICLSIYDGRQQI